jgi:hypothetical protein
VAFAGYLAWKRVGVRIDWGLQAMEFDTFSGRWCFLDGSATKAGRAEAGQAKGELGYTLGWGAGLGLWICQSVLVPWSFLCFCISLLFVHLQV